MKIDLEYPFKNTWKYGYLVINKEPRRNVILYNSSKDRKTISYARYLMSVHLGKLLEDDVIVDHINDDKMDDRIENYQLISCADNIRKMIKFYGKGQRMVEFQCGVCNKIFSRARNKTQFVIKKKNDFCSRDCAHEANRPSSEKYKSKVLREYQNYK